MTESGKKHFTVIYDFFFNTVHRKIFRIHSKIDSYSIKYGQEKVNLGLRIGISLISVFNKL
jgi:hypothetical protein